MGREDTVRLIEYLQNESAHHVRSVLHYGGEEYDAEFIRVDVLDEYSTHDAEARIRQLRTETEARWCLQYCYDLGDLNASLNRFDDVAELHLPHPDRSGTVVTLDSGGLG